MPEYTAYIMVAFQANNDDEAWDAAERIAEAIKHGESIPPQPAITGATVDDVSTDG